MEILLFGAGSACKNFINKTKNSEYKILGILDNDSKKWGDEIQGFKILNPKSISRINKFKDILIIIVSESYKEIEEQLLKEFNLDASLIKVAPKSLISNSKSYRPFENEDVYICAKKILKELSSIFNKNQLKYFVDHGTLLGLVRHGDIMRWDDDIDFSILEEDYKKAKYLFVKYFREQIDIGSNIKRVDVIERIDNNIEKAVKALVEIESSNMNYIINIDLAYIKIIDDIAYERFTKANKHHFTNSDKIIYEDTAIRVPYNYRDYLNYHYGADWENVKKDISWNEIKNLI